MSTPSVSRGFIGCSSVFLRENRRNTEEVPKKWHNLPRITEYAPIFAQVRLNTPHNQRSLFLDIKGGYDLANVQGIIFLGQIGMLFKYLGVGVGMGYSTAYNGSDRLKFCITASYDLPLNKILY